MLGRLLGGLSSLTPAAGAPSTPESHLDELHTRSLLFGNVDTSELSASTAYFRPGPFDDHNGLDWDGKRQFRVIIAQNAVADLEKPCILLDTKASFDTLTNPRSATRLPGHVRESSSVFGRSSPSVPRSPLPVANAMNSARNRSSTISGTTWTPQILRDTDSKDFNDSLLDCMFGSLGSSTARTTSTTKMHVIAADTDRVANLHSPGALNVASPASRKREPLHRAQTSGTSSRIQASLSSAHDFVLITRTFTAADSAGTQQTHSQSKVQPAFAVALLVQLPTESRPTSRPASRNLLSPPGQSASSSLGSDLQSSWTDLSSLTSLTSSKYLAELTDHRIEQLVHNFNIVEDCLSGLQQIASSEIYEHVKQSDTHTLSAWALVENARLRNAAEDVVRRVAYGLMIPRAVVGVGLGPGGHWLEEARTAFSGPRQQFFFRVLTGYLGCHTDWLTRLGTFAQKRPRKDAKVGGRNRTVVLCDTRTAARRLVFLLASFMQAPREIFQSFTNARTAGTSKALTLNSPPNTQLFRKESLRRAANRRFRESRLNPGAPTIDTLSINDGTTHKPALLRRPSGTPSIRTMSALPISPNDVRKTSSTVTPNPATPLAYFTSTSHSGAEPDSYFPNILPNENKDSAASSLARLATNSSGTSTGSVKWSSFLGFWGGKVESAQNLPPRKGSVGTLNYGTSPTDVAIETTASYPPNHGVPQSRQADTSSVSSPQTIPPRLQASSDGVIDVDINIPGFFSKSLEAGLRSAVPFTTQRSPSSKSIDGSSMHSSKSYADALTSRESPDPINVAGFLKRYHPDFILQAVKPYPEITAEIKASMSSEPTPAVEETGHVGERWIDVCETLLADVNHLTVKRLILRRKIPAVGLEARMGSSNTVQTPTEGMLPSAVSGHTSYRELSIEAPEEAFLTETLVDFDTTLAEAIERALNEQATFSPQRGHSRTVSSTSTANITPPSSFDADQVRPPLEHSRQVVVGALQEIVKSINDNMHEHERGQNIAAPTPAKLAEREENALREGVKKWIRRVEHTEVW